MAPKPPVVLARAAFAGALLLLLIGVPASLAWIVAISADAAPLLVPLLLGGGALAVATPLLILGAVLSLRAEAALRAELDAERRAAAEIGAKEEQLHKKLEDLGTSHDTMYSLLFKSRRLSHVRADDEGYVRR